MASNTASVVYIPSLKDLIFAVIIFSSMFSVTAAWCVGGCFKEGFVCCNSACIQGSSCVGLRCSNYDGCSSGETCCNNICVNGTSCLGKGCSVESDCASSEVCCSGTCKDGYAGCIGLSCKANYDCTSYENCCGGICSYEVDCDDFAIWILLCSISACLFIILFLFMLVVCFCRRRRRYYGRVLEGGRLPSVTTVGDSSLSYPYLPSYQQSYPYFPQPQYVRYPPNNVGPAKTSEAPPPYNRTSEEASGVVNTPHINYGAVSNSL